MNRAGVMIILVCILCLGCKPEEPDSLTIAAAANVQFAIKALVRSFTEETGIACKTVVSSSGKLTAQIREGAPFDVFLSADMKYPAELYKHGLTTAAPKVYAYGSLVMWSLARTDPSVDLLTEDEIRHIALANPVTAPYGAAAVDVLKHYRIYEKVKDKLVIGESIAQTNQFIFSGAAGIGFTARSVVLSPEMRDKGSWAEVAADAYTPIAQGMVIIKHRYGQADQAQQFHEFLFSGRGKQILEQFGYLADKP